MTKHPDLFASLAAPFHPDEVKVRTQSGRPLHYVTARTVMNRLDDVVGPEGWWDEYTPGENSVLCRLTVRLPDGSTLTKADAGGYAGMADSGDDDKSGYSDAFKRAAVKFGVSRYLYRDGVPKFVQAHAPAAAADMAPQPQAGQDTGRGGGGNHGGGHDRGPSHQGGGGRDGGNGNGNGNGSSAPRQGGGGGGGHGGPPRSGRALFAWTKEQEQKHEVDLLKYLNSWSKLQDFPGRMVDWDADQVQRAHAEAERKLASHVGAGRGEADESDLGN